mmetsp:Transcript_16163/g.21884  ORF Transcript_16163/g.21884 Transcript_16163/m.21884 type:complete len:213 (+) Transcript_16163:390-1028(+)
MEPNRDGEDHPGERWRGKELATKLRALRVLAVAPVTFSRLSRRPGHVTAVDNHNHGSATRRDLDVLVRAASKLEYAVRESALTDELRRGARVVPDVVYSRAVLRDLRALRRDLRDLRFHGGGGVHFGLLHAWHVRHHVLSVYGRRVLAMGAAGLVDRIGSCRIVDSRRCGRPRSLRRHAVGPSVGDLTHDSRGDGVQQHGVIEREACERSRR